MLEIVELLIHFIATVVKLLKPGGVKVVMAETMVMKHQLIVMNRGKKRSPALITRDRFLFGILALFIGERRLQKVAVILKPATILAFHKALIVTQSHNRDVLILSFGGTCFCCLRIHKANTLDVPHKTTRGSRSNSFKTHTQGSSPNRLSIRPARNEFSDARSIDTVNPRGKQMIDFDTKNFAALIGIDWADKKHDICELPMDHSGFSFTVISSRPESIHDWAMSLRERYPDKSVAVACELKKGPLINALLKYDHITIFPINPSTVAKYRKAFVPSGAKSDPSDAKLQTEILRDHGGKLRAIEPDSAEVRALGQLVESRRKLVQDRVDLTNTITAYLKNYFPQVLDWFKEKDTHIFCDFIARWPSLQHARRARKQTLIGFFNQHNARYLAANQQRIEQIRTATALTADPGVVEPSRLLIELLTPQLKGLLKAIERIDQEIKQRYKAMPDNEIFSSFPAAGPQMAPRLMVAFGSNRDRYAAAHELQKYSGIAPVIESSGNQTWTHWRYSCPKFLRQTFVEWAGLTVRYSFWARAYYEQQKSKGKPHNTIIRSLAFKWIRIMFKCWKDQTRYDESKYLQALKDRHAPLLKFAVGA